MKERDIKFIVVPKGSSFTYSSFGEYLNTFSSTDGNETSFMVGTVRKNGFYIQHSVITKIKSQSADWKKNFEFYEQVGEGKEQPYSIPTRKKCEDEKRNISQLAEIRERNKKQKNP